MNVLDPIKIFLKDPKRAAFISFLMTALLWTTLFGDPPLFSLSLSESMKCHLFKREKGLPLRGDFVSFSWKKNIRFIKRLQGLPGDALLSYGEVLKVGSSWKGPLFHHTQKGDPLTPNPFKMIPEGFGFVAGDHPKSFDSRYKEVGLIPFEKIEGKYRCLF